jgi:putative ATP-dependent endonuclease of OLD family
LKSLKTTYQLAPPGILIELYFEIEHDSLRATFEGNGNSLKQKACGIKFQIAFDEKYQPAYNILLQNGDNVRSLPIEYYDFSWSSFARDDRLTPTTIPFKSALIDSANTRYQSGADIYVSRVIRDILSEEVKVRISQAHRKLKDTFAEDDVIKEVNKEIEQKKISDKKVELSVDMSTKTAWETSITTYFDDIPFSYIGRGEQCMIKTKLALSRKKSQEAHILLLEEPENHLSHAKLNKLINHIKESHEEKQIVVSTHSSFVANKLGLSSLILLNIDKDTNKRNETRLTDLDEGTKKYFDKLAGFDTLRLILCRKAILVEGPSDELVVQKAYRDKTKGKLPIGDEVDVISVGNSFLRFLEIAEKIRKPVVVVTDNDKDYQNKVVKKYKTYEKYPFIKICADSNNDLWTLETQIVWANKNQMDTLRRILGIKSEDYPDEESITDYMRDNKTDCALKIFDTTEPIKLPQYILDATNWAHE